MDHAALKAEIDTDPSSLGLVAMRDAGNHAGIAAALNLIRAGISIARGVVPARLIVNEIDWADVVELQRNNLQAVLAAGEVDTDAARVRSALSAAFSAGSGSRTRLAALANRPGSRAEQLFGRGETVTVEDVARALGTWGMLFRESRDDQGMVTVEEVSNG